MLLIILQILSTPAIVLGIVAFIGLLLQKKALEQIITGTIKTILGFVILGGGATILVSSLDPFGNIFQAAFNIKGIVPNNEAIVAISLNEYATVTALIMVFGMLANIIIARFTPLKYIFLTGHHIFYMACLLSVVFSAAQINQITTIIVGSLILGIIMSILPALVQPTMDKITNSNNISMGHFNTTGYLLSSLVGKLFANKSQSTETLNIPKSLGFLRDSTVSISITMFVLYLVVALNTPSMYIENNISNGQNFVLYTVLQSITFAAGIYIILQGVRLLLAEIVPAFVGISEKLIPNAKIALDCPIVFPYAPNAVMIGFLFSFLGGLVGLGILGSLHTILILPSVVPHFFTGATAGVFGNATGGRKGAMLGAFCNGLLITFLPIMLIPLLGDLGFANTTFSDSDFSIVGAIIGNILH